MGWWPFGSSSSNAGSSQSFYSPQPPTSQFDKYVPPPPGGSPFAELPPPPPSSGKSALFDYDKAADGSNKTSWMKDSGGTRDYLYDDLKKYVSPYRETNALDDDKHAQYESSPAFIDRVLTSPRSRNCFENIKQGIKMGAAVGGIFGTFSGLYVAASMRNVALLPLSIIAGAGSFGFFLACGQLIRCEELPPHSSVDH